jgi:hypothetical protein
MTAAKDLTFKCYSCSREFHWRDDLPGRTIRCKCGVKFKCPDLAAESLIADQSMEDTVADVSLNEAFDSLEDPHGDEGAYEVGPADIKERGLFGLGPAGETLLWGVGALLGVAFGLLAVIVGAWMYIACAVVLSISAVKFYRSWKRWTNGRPWMECLMESLGESQAEGGRESA